MVHTEGEQDGVSIVGVPSERWGVEVGLGPDVSYDRLAEIEAEIARFPAFIGGCESELKDEAIVLGWSGDDPPDAQAIGTAIHAWTSALFDLDLVDVRIVFAPSRGRSAVLTDMRARARAFRLYRDAVIAGHPDPESVVVEFQNQNRESE